MNKRRPREAAQALRRFALAPASARPIAALRIGLAAVLLAQAAETAQTFFRLPATGPAKQVVDALVAHGAKPSEVLLALGGAYVIALLALLAGAYARAAAALAWLAHAALTGGSLGQHAAADSMAHVALLYLVWTPCGATLAVDGRRRKKPCMPSPAARLGLRMLQVHLCAVYASSGLAKASMPGWWNGDAIWKALAAAQHTPIDPAWLSAHPWLGTVSGWLVLAVELGYPVLMWPRRTRRTWVVTTAALHLAVAVLLGPAVLGAVMTVLTVAAFGIPAEPVRRER
jgi:hypothetical protein